mgnify:CR=1 FL=1
MPFYKDKIGATPYYVHAYETRYFQPETCERVQQSLRSIGIDAHKASGTYACVLTYLDIYSTSVQDISASSFFKSLVR